MPAIARRFSNRDRPPRACDRGSGNQGSTYFHTSSGTSANLASIPSKDHVALRLATFQQVRGGALMSAKSLEKARKDPLNRFCADAEPT